VKSKAKFIPVLFILAILMSLVAIIPTFASVRGGATIIDPADTTKALTWARQGGTIVLEVKDADLDVSTAVTSETLTFAACAANGDLRTVQVTKVPIVDSGTDGVVNFSDVTVSSDGTAATTIFQVDGANGVVVIKCGASHGSATTQEVDYKAATANTVGVAEDRDTATTSIVWVTSDADSKGLGVKLTETAVQSGIFRATIDLVSGASSASLNSDSEPDLQVGASDVVKISYTDAAPTPSTTVSDTVVVESTATTFSNFSPTHGIGTQVTRPTVKADVTDADSLVKKTTIKIVFVVDADNDNIVDSGEQSEVTVDTSGTITTITGGFKAEQRLPAASAPTADAQLFWWVKSEDNGGNVGVSDRLAAIGTTGDVCVPGSFPATASLVGVTISDLTSNTAAVSKCQPYMVKIDFTDPDMTSSTTGTWWDTSKTTTDKTETTASKAKTDHIIVNFNEAIDGTTVTTGDFTIDGVVPLSATHFSGNSDAVFLTTSTLNPDKKPVIKLVGTVMDVAGNDLTIDEVTSADGIAPTVTVTVTGDAAATIPGAKSAVTINFGTNEAATVDSTSVAVKAMVTATTVNTVTSTGSPALVTAKNWKVTATPASAGVHNVYVSASDLAGNAGTAGHATDPSNSSAILFEKDTAIPDPIFTPTSTDDPNAFLILDFSNEGKEYGINVAANAFVSEDFATTAVTVGTDKDTHSTVTIKTLTLDGVDILSSVNTEDNIMFLYKSSGLSIGDHTIKVKAVDAVGNEMSEKSFTAKVTEKKLFSVKLNPGWNLVSLPNSPADSAINTVISSTMPVDTVLSYSGGSWKTAVRNTTSGNLEGNLSILTAGTAYWVHTTSFQAIKVNIPGTSGGQQVTPPTVSLSVGWNLVPAIDVSGAKVAGDSLDVTLTQYLANVTWSRVYEYDTLTSKFTNIVGTASPTVGKGYWAYVTTAGILVP
jgi:hypothetical protein